MEIRAARLEGKNHSSRTHYPTFRKVLYSVLVSNKHNEIKSRPSVFGDCKWRHVGERDIMQWLDFAMHKKELDIVIGLQSFKPM
jgi:hypothetical protein